MNEEETYTLKPFKILERESYANPYIGGLTDERWRIEYSASTKGNSKWQTGYISFCDPYHADEMFVSVSEYKEQLREQIISYNGHAQIEAKNPDGTVAELTVRFADPDTLIDEILGLVDLFNTPEGEA